MSTHHAEVLADVPAAATFWTFRRGPGLTARALVDALAAAPPLPGVLIAIGPGVLAELDTVVPGVASFPDLTAEGSAISVPCTPLDLWVRVRGDDPGQVLHRARALRAALPSDLIELDRTDGFVHDGGRDLTGYEDGTENPDPEEAPAVALAGGLGPGLDGGSVVVVQRWVHRFDAFDAMPKPERDHAIGRERVSNDELVDAPESAHVKRTAQEDFEPEAFIWRRSMPWSDARGAGLLFVSFSATVAPFLAQMRRMVGLDDGITDALFRFTAPVSSAVAWCPPLADGRLDLRALASTPDSSR